MGTEFETLWEGCNLKAEEMQEKSFDSLRQELVEFKLNAAKKS